MIIAAKSTLAQSLRRMTRAWPSLGILGALTIAACAAPAAEVDRTGKASSAAKCTDCGDEPAPDPVPDPDPVPRLSTIKYSAVFSATTGKGSKVLLGRPESEFFSTTNAWAETGYRLVDIDVAVVDGQRVYSGVFEPASDPWALYILPWSDFVAKNAQLQGQGLKLVDIETYDNAGRWFVGVWRTDGTGRHLSGPWSRSTFDAQVQTEAKNGYRIKDVEVYVENGQERIVGLWEEKADFSFAFTQYGDWNSFASKWFYGTLSYGGNHLTDMEAYVNASGTREYMGVWQSSSTVAHDDLVAATSQAVLERKIDELALQGKYPIEIEMEFGGDQPPVGLAVSFKGSLDGQVQGYSFAIAEAGVVTAAGGNGYARSLYESVTPGVETTASTRQDIASTTKTVTAVALLSLLESTISFADPQFDAKLDAQLDRTIVDVLGTDLAGVTLGAGVDQITLRHLLNHKSGFRNESTNRGDKMNFGYSCSPDYKAKIREVFAEDTTRMPGSGDPIYDNFNFCTLRSAIEKLSGQDYETYLAQKVFAPVGITMDCVPYTGLSRVLYYSGTDLSGAGWTGDDATFLHDVCGAGGLQSTASGSVDFLLGLRNNAILRPQTWTKMKSDQLGIWKVDLANNLGTAYLHNGGMGQNFDRGNSTGWGSFPSDTQAVLYVNTAYKGLDAAQVLRIGYENMHSY